MNHIIEQIAYTAFLSLVNVGIYIVLYKFRVIEFYGLYKRRWMPACDFCLFFWMALIEIVSLITGDIALTLIGAMYTIKLALFAAVISRKFL